jgi:hypothetical protein
MSDDDQHEEKTPAAIETDRQARRELDAIGKIIDLLEPLPTLEKRCRVLAAAAAALGHYDIAHNALHYAEQHHKAGS